MGDAIVNESSTMYDRIEKWIDGFIANRAFERDDVHVDQLDERYRSRDAWLRGALLALTSAAAITARKNLPITVAVEFFLREGDVPGTLHLRSLDDLSSENFSWTPPALTIYRRGDEPWRTQSLFAPIELSCGRQAASWSKALLQEWYDEAEGNYDRRLWLVVD